MWTVRCGRPARASSNLPSRRLIIRPGGIGDCILSLPAIEHLRADYTEVWVPSSIVPLIRFAQGAIASHRTGIDLLGLPGVEPPAGFDREAAILRFDCFVVRLESRGVSRPGERIRIAVSIPGCFARTRREDPCRGFLSEAGRRNGRRSCRALKCERRMPGDFAVIHPFSGSARKNWPLDRFREVASRLSMPVRWCAGPEETLEDAVRFENLYDLACWLAGARLYIGNDSGITHLAAAVGIPTLAIFVASDPEIWAPRGKRVQVLNARASPDVFGIAKSLMSE